MYSNLILQNPQVTLPLFSKNQHLKLHGFKLVILNLTFNTK